MLQHVYNQYHIHAISQNSSDNLVYDQHKNSCFQYHSIRHIELQVHLLSQNLVVLLSKNREKGEKDMAVKTVQTLAAGTNTITVVAKDGAGKTTTVTRTVTLDTAAPVIKSVTLTPNPVDAGKTFIISVEVTD